MTKETPKRSDMIRSFLILALDLGNWAEWQTEEGVMIKKANVIFEIVLRSLWMVFNQNLFVYKELLELGTLL